ncbi:hypothetical protein BJV78DRAFT_1288210 [Lactifluus subvellereus]|nr:hypothetical protein BJV78DRAFT_1288210 [Lactifluus subvellereus]
MLLRGANARESRPIGPPANTVPPTSLLPSALRAVGRPPKPSSTSSVSFEVVPPISEIPPIDGNLYDDDDYDQLPPPPPPPPPQKQSQLRGQRTPTLLHTATPTCSRSSWWWYQTSPGRATLGPLSISTHSRRH